jgi:uncharacterized repeat protein (TIGR01451 family)
VSGGRSGSLFRVSAAVAFALALSLGSTASARPHQLHGSPSTACKRGETRARIAGKSTCLRAGKPCLKRLDRQYHRYGFHCHTGRLTRKSKPKPPPTTKRADLSISVADAPDPVSVGAELAYTISVANGGPSAADQVTVSGIPTGAISPDPGWACSPNAPAECVLRELESGAGSRIRVVVRPATPGTLTSTFRVSSGVADPNNANNSAGVETTVVAVADLGVAAADTPDPAVAGSDLTYTITVSNAGPAAAESVRVVVSPPSGAVSFVSALASQGSCTTAVSAECSLGMIGAGASAAVTIVVRPAAAGSLTTSASAASATQDPNAANNTASIATTVTSPTPPPPPPGNCAASYPDVCIPPPPPDLDCKDIPYRNFRVIYTVPNPDPHGFDGDHDGVGCET